jgi:hypothetical protein
MWSRVSSIAAALGGALVVLSCASEEEDAAPTCGPETGELPEHLACTGLYADYKTKTIAPNARPYAPGVSFWSDGYEKTRYLALPDGATIDARDPDQWTFPVGTKVWKEFRAGSRRIETRLLWKVAADRWLRTAYAWSEDGKSATRVDGRSLTVAGSPYDVPSPAQCDGCHRGKKDTLLGIEAVSLALPTATGITLATLAAENRLSPAPARTTLTIDRGLGVLHVNCGVSCHNGTPGAKGGDSTLRLRIGFDEAATKPASAWELVTTTVRVPTSLPAWSGEPRITPGAPERSVVVKAMSTQGTGQMPPSTRDVDFDGVGAVETWIRSLPP